MDRGPTRVMYKLASVLTRWREQVGENHVQSVVVLYRLAWVYRLAQSKIDVGERRKSKSQEGDRRGCI